MARKTYEELQEIMKQENVSRIWSWSKFNCFKTSPFEYYLKYILHKKEDRQDCIYTSTGSLAHDIIEKLYTNFKIFVDGFCNLDIDTNKVIIK